MFEEDKMEQTPEQRANAFAAAGVQDPITTNDLSSAPVVDFQAPQLSPIFDVSAMQVPTFDSTPKEQEAQSIVDRLMQTSAGLQGQSMFRTAEEDKLGVNDIRKTQADLAGRIGQIQAEAKSIPLQLQQDSTGRGITAGGLQPIQTAALRKNAIQALSTSALLQASQGQLTTALDQVDRAVEARFGPVKEEIDTLMGNLDLILKSPEFSRQDKQRAATQLALQQQRAKQAGEEERLYREVQEIAVNAAANGADALTLRKIQGMSNPIEAARLAAPFTGKAEKLDIQLKEAQIRKTNAEAQKTLAEASGSAGGMNPTDLIAYAQQWASTGKIPTGLPKGTFGVVSQFAKEMPKQSGTIIDVNTGVKPDISDAKLDGFAALYDISKKIQQLKELDKERQKGIIPATFGKVFGSSDQQKYIDLRGEIVDLLARARTGAALTTNEEKFYSNQLPSRVGEVGPFGLFGVDTQVRLNNFEEKINGTLQTKLSAQGASIVGYSTVRLGNNEYRVGDIIEINDKKGRVLSDGSIVEIQ